MGILIHHSDTSSSSSSKAVAEAVADATALTSSEATIMTSEAAALTVIRGGGLATHQLLRNALRKRSFIDQIITCGGDNNESKFYVHKLVMSVHSR
jgi:ABC-type sulfate transport system permease component